MVVQLTQMMLGESKAQRSVHCDPSLVRSPPFKCDDAHDVFVYFSPYHTSTH